MCVFVDGILQVEVLEPMVTVVGKPHTLFGTYWRDVHIKEPNLYTILKIYH